MEFADLDDDLFCGERQRNNTNEEYAARFCNQCWFLEATPDILVSEEDTLGVQKHCADYFYFKKDYETAVAKYEDILRVLPVGNTTVRRECYEGIARSYMKMGTLDKAVEFAERLHATSKTSEQTTVSCSVLVDCNIAAERYPEALKASQILVSLHPFNSDVWLKLACIYAFMYGIKLASLNKLFSATYQGKDVVVNRMKCTVDETSVIQDAKGDLQNKPYSLENIEKKTTAVNSNTCEEVLSDQGISHKENELSNQMTFTEEEKGLQFVCACLHRSFMMLKRTEATSFGFALDSNFKCQKRILSDMDTLLDEKSLCYVKQQISRSDAIYSSNSPVKESSLSEFIDRGSSKFKEDETDADVAVVSRKSFERQWFKWIK